MRNLIYRLFTSAMLLPIVFFILYLGGAFLNILLALVALLCAFEIAGIIMPRNIRTTLYSCLMSLGILLPIMIFKESALLIAFLSLTFFVFNIIFLFSQGDAQKLEKYSTIFHFNAYVALSLASIYWLQSEVLNLSRSTGFAFIILACCTTWANDTLAYFGGRLLGKTPLFKRVSAKKTWEGFFSGALGSIAVVLILFFSLKGAGFLSFIGELNLCDCLLIAIPGAILAPLGDLIESRLKRVYEVKDSSNLLPGHGGFLDRIDGLLVMLPWTALYAFFIRNLW